MPVTSTPLHPSAQLLHELRQLLQAPLPQGIPSAFQTHAAGKLSLVQIDPDLAACSHLPSCILFLGRRSKRVLRRSPFSYRRAPRQGITPPTGLFIPSPLGRESRQIFLARRTSRHHRFNGENCKSLKSE